MILGSIAWRSSNLGWSEFQGDEARAALLAEKFVTGEVESIFTHRKGPGEILTVAASAEIFGFDSEFWLRIPFALAGVAVVCAIAAIVTQTASPLLGVLAFLIALQDGVLLGFSRIVQYQMPMLLFALGGWLLIVTDRWKQKPCWLGLLFAASLLCHYDAIFLVAPGLLVCLYFSYIQKDSRSTAVIACAVTLLIALSFYVPFVESPTFATTQQYLERRADSSSLPRFNIPRWLNTWDIYSGFAASVLFTLIFGTTLWLRCKRISVATVLFGAVILAFSELRSVPAIAMAIFSVTSIAYLMSFDAKERISTILWLIPLFIFGFWFARPNTHFLIATPVFICACLFALRRSPGRIQQTLVLASLTALCFSLVHQREFFLGHGTARPRVRTAVVEFGFSHRTGLSEASRFLIGQKIRGEVVTNDDQLVADWYLRNIPAGANNSAPEIALLISNPREGVPLSLSIKSNYALIGRVFVKQKRAVDIFRLRSSIPADFKPQRILD